MLSAFKEDWDVGSIYVYPPLAVVLLCGGPMTDIGEMPPRSLRDAFYKVLDKPYFENAELIRAEDTDLRVIESAKYEDLLRFEIELAQICEVILLFCESIGSVSEFSSFVMDEDINRKLLVVMRDDHFYAASFLREGPTRRLIGIDPEAVYLIEDFDLGIRPGSVDGIDLAKLGRRLAAPITRALERGREHETFRPERPGHVIKLATGLVQEFGALTLAELVDLLRHAKVQAPADGVAGYMLCAQAAGWVELRRKGSRDFYFAKQPKSAAAFKFASGSKFGEKGRRRFLLREHWKTNDEDRYRGILDNEGTTR